MVQKPRYLLISQAFDEENELDESLDNKRMDVSMILLNDGLELHILML